MIRRICKTVIMTGFAILAFSSLPVTAEEESSLSAC